MVISYQNYSKSWDMNCYTIPFLILIGTIMVPGWNETQFAYMYKGVSGEAALFACLAKWHHLTSIISPFFLWTNGFLFALDPRFVPKAQFPFYIRPEPVENCRKTPLTSNFSNPGLLLVYSLSRNRPRNYTRRRPW